MKTKLVASPASSFRGQTIYVSEKQVLRGAYICPDKSTLVFAFNDQGASAAQLALRSAIRAANGPNGNWTRTWQKVADHDFSFVALNEGVDFLQLGLGQTGQAAITSSVGPILEATDYFVGSANYSEDKTDIETAIYCADGTDIAEITDAVKGVVALAKMSLKTAQKNMAKSNSSSAEKELGSQMMDLPIALLEAMKIESNSDRVVMKTQLSREQEKLLKPLIPVIASTRAAARRVESANRMRQLAIGMHNYHDSNGHFPPPVLISDSGKKYSWRVALLPYIDENQIFEQYRFDEDWNSEHNRKLTEATPAAFQHPNAIAAGSNQCSYFVITGKGTPFNGNEGTKLAQITDGTSATLMIVESKKDVHWAEPTDIKFENGKLDSQLGGFSPGGFNGSLCDASTHFWREDMDKQYLEILIQHADGQPTNWTELQKHMSR